jgi:hypothetical protein
MTNINYKNSIVRYTVRLSDLKKGTITAVEQEQIKVGDFERNIQFIDDFGNNMGIDGIILEIMKEEIL